MAKTFYTERDIEELAQRGVHSLVVNDNIVLTELAVERAMRLGVALVREHDTPPSAPVRPYLSPAPQAKPGSTASEAGDKQDLHERIRAAVIARLGSQVDPALLDGIIRRVLDQVAAK